MFKKYRIPLLVLCLLIGVAFAAVLAVYLPGGAADESRPPHSDVAESRYAEFTTSEISATASIESTNQSIVQSNVDAQTEAASAGTGHAVSSSAENSLPDASAPAGSAVSPGGTGDAAGPQTAESLLRSMTLFEKVGQLFIVRPEALNYNLSTNTANSTPGGLKAVNSDTAAMLQRYPVGGVCFFGANIAAPAQLTAFTGGLQKQSKVPLFIAVDEEGGRVARVANTEGFPVPTFESMLAIGATGDTNNAYHVGTAIGGYLKTYGFNLDFAPVADVFTNPQNTVIGDRAFGSDPRLVARMVTAEISGLHDAGIMSAIKHFPGHGDTTADTHAGTVTVDKTWEQLKQCELIPFSVAFASTDMVMISHITTPKITTDGLPASLSREMLTGRLRGELGYTGVIITDSLEMKAITANYSAADAAVKAFSAGADLLLLPGDLISAYNGVYNAVINGTISAQRLDESVLRILRLKEKYGLLQ